MKIKLTFKLDDFEGPLDLLLGLISKHKMDIYDIEILTLINQYLKYIKNLHYENLDFATEFLEMASRLVYIKSSLLLPKNEDVDELTQELKGQLIEYKLIKEISLKLKEKYVGDMIFFKEKDEIEYDKTYTKTHEKEELRLAFLMVIGKNKRRLPPDKKEFHNIVQRPIVSVKSRITFIMKLLYNNGKEDFKVFFDGCDDNSEKVATFLAMLELIKIKKVKISLDNSKIYFN